ASQLSYSPDVHIINRVNGAHNMKPQKQCQRLIPFLTLSAEKAAKSAMKLRNIGGVFTVFAKSSMKKAATGAARILS
ncbi:hypothetical protein, partial [Yersinia ruckeri]|uniref:hypothetical protein n=1 Tax=Yersinia ruckeri TaxID=29486 RepID=UPI0020BF6075